MEGSHDILTQKRIHKLVSTVVNTYSCKHFKVPKLHQSYDSEYFVENFSTRNPITIGELSKNEHYKEYVDELCVIWKEVWYHGFALYDFKLYVQSDKSIFLMDFAKTGFRMTSGPTLFAFPFAFPNQEYFFDHSCFSQSFILTLFGKENPIEFLRNYPYREKVETRNPG